MTRGGRRRNTIRKIGGEGSYDEYKRTYRSLRDNAKNDHYHIYCSVVTNVTINKKYNVTKDTPERAYADNNSKRIYIYLNATKNNNDYNLYGTIGFPAVFNGIIANHTEKEFTLTLSNYFIKKKNSWVSSPHHHKTPIEVKLKIEFTKSIATAFYKKDDTYWVFAPHDSKGQFYIIGTKDSKKVIQMVLNPSQTGCNMNMVSFPKKDGFDPLIDNTLRATVEKYYNNGKHTNTAFVRVNKYSDCGYSAIIGSQNGKVTAHPFQVNTTNRLPIYQTVPLPDNFIPFNQDDEQMTHEVFQQNWDIHMDPKSGHSYYFNHSDGRRMWMNQDTDAKVLSPTDTIQKGPEADSGKPALAVPVIKTPTTSSDISTQLKTIIDIQKQILAEIRLNSQPASQPASQIDSPHSV